MYYGSKSEVINGYAYMTKNGKTINNYNMYGGSSSKKGKILDGAITGAAIGALLGSKKPFNNALMGAVVTGMLSTNVSSEERIGIRHELELSREEKEKEKERIAKDKKADSYNDILRKEGIADQDLSSTLRDALTPFVSDYPEFELWLNNPETHKYQLILGTATLMTSVQDDYLIPLRPLFWNDILEREDIDTNIKELIQEWLRSELNILYRLFSIVMQNQREYYDYPMFRFFDYLVTYKMTDSDAILIILELIQNIEISY